jgi:2Fe-2S ferredoxin
MVRFPHLTPGVTLSTVHVLPVDLLLEVVEGQTVMAAALDAGYVWPTVCEGSASCGTCISVVKEGAENCAAMPDDELETLTRILVPLDGQRRLACRLQVTGPVTLNKRGIRPQG